MIPRCGGAGTPSDGFRLEDATVNDHDEATDSTRMWLLTADEADLARIQGHDVRGCDGSWRARMTAAEKRALAATVQWANRRVPLRGLSAPSAASEHQTDHLDHGAPEATEGAA